MNDLTGDFGVLVFGIAATLLFIAGYLYTIKEFNEMKDERKRKENKKGSS